MSGVGQNKQILLAGTLEFGWPLSAEVETSLCAESSTVLMSNSYTSKTISFNLPVLLFSGLLRVLPSKFCQGLGVFWALPLWLFRISPLNYSCPGRSILCSLAPPATDCGFLLEFVASLHHLDWGRVPEKAACKCRKKTNLNTCIPATWYLEAKSWDVIAFRRKV